MPPHLSEDDLILHFYGDGPVDHEAAVDEHLGACPACQALWVELTGTLKMIDAASVPEPDADFEQRMWARVQPALSAERPPRASFVQGVFGRRTGNGHWSAWLGPAVGLAAAAAVAVVVGRAWPTTRQPAAPPPASVRAAAPDPVGRERVLLTALGDHFQRSEMLLVELLNAPAAGGDDVGFDQETADDLVESSRLYRMTAQQNGNVRLARMLEDLESVLVQIARSPEQMDRQDFHSLRARIEDDSLLFKVRAVSKQIEERQKSLATE